MLKHRSDFELSVVWATAFVALFAGSAFGQSPANSLDSRPLAVAAAETQPGIVKTVDSDKPRTIGLENKAAADGTKTADMESDIAAMKAENAAVRELLRKMEEQQKVLLDQVDRLQQRLDGTPTANAQPAEQPLGPLTADAQPANAANNSAAPAPVPAKPAKEEERYKDGIVIWETNDDAKIPFSLKFNVNTQFRYLNTTSSDETYTDHLGNVRDVHRRNDLTVNRTMFILGGYVFDKRLRYSMTVWTSAGAASIVIAGNIGWRFSKAFTLTAGYTGVPGSRSLINTFPFFAGIDRSMADNFFRPGFTQGVWANGEFGKGFSYIAFVGNGLNTLNISANKIDPHLLLSGSVWWEPLGSYGDPGKARNMYDDYAGSGKVRIRIGTSFTRSREDRFSNVEQSNPDNTSLYNSDGVLSFSTGAFAPGVTLQKAMYKMWATDWGLKWKGLAVNGQYFVRWLDHFEADGPLPLASTFDHGYELSVGQFVKPKKLMLYGRGSQVFGQFGNSSEYGGGARWYFLPTERVWLNAEVMKVNHSPYGGAFTPYTTGMNGWVPMVQTVLAF